MGGHTVAEISGNKRVVREYDAAGNLVRIRVLPLSKDADLPPIEPTASRPPASSAARALFWRKERAPEPAAEPPRAPEPTPAAEPLRIVAPEPPRAPPEPEVRARFRDEPAPEPGVIDVVVEELAAPEPVAAAPAAPPAPIVFHEPEPLVPEPEPEATPIRIVDPERPSQPEAAPPAPRTFEILAVERVAPPQPDPEPTPPPPQPIPEPEPEPTPPPPPPPPAPPETPPFRFVEPEPERPRRPLRDAVPDLDARVDAALATGDAPSKRRKRAPLPVPAFPPLRREPWEERLDAALRDP